MRVSLAATDGRRSRSSLLAGVVLALCASSVVASPAEAGVHAFPVLSAGSQGTDVRILQYLLRGRGYVVTADGSFGQATVDAVRSFQVSLGLSATGTVTIPTWGRLIVTLFPGDRGSAVKALQLGLNEKHAARIRVTGVFDAATRSAVLALQRHIGLTADGVAGAQTWRLLVWHFEQPRFALRSLCSYSNPPNYDRAHWGTAETVAGLERAAARAYPAGLGPVAVGDISLEHGGDIGGHTYHEEGLDADVRPMRDARNQCASGVTWYRWSSGRKICCNPAYDRTATRALIRALRAASPGHVHYIWFNDPQLIAEGLTRYHTGHDDHLHVSYCEESYSIAAYEC
jgi:peptidoglycan hydrolase-like protein with peptidoglycan-binding domain